MKGNKANLQVTVRCKSKAVKNTKESLARNLQGTHRCSGSFNNK
jgi:hypothetical protein